MTSGSPRRWLSALFALIALMVAGCSDTPSDATAADATSEPLRIAVSLPPQAWLVQQIGGEHVAVEVLVRPGASPETFLPSDHEISRVLAVRAYLRIGVPFENGPWFEALRQAGPRVFDQRESLQQQEQQPPEHGRAKGRAPHDHGGEDPHTWLSPSNLRQQASNVTEVLCEVDPQTCDIYQQRSADLDLRLQALDTELRQQLAPYAGRSFLVFHPSWGHFAQAYGLHQAAIEVEGKAPSDSELTEVQRLARRQGLRVVFVQPQVTSRAAEAVAQALDGCTVTLDPLGSDLEAMLRRTAAALVESYEHPC